MKTKIPILIILVTSVLFAGAEVFNFQAKSQGGNIYVTWQTASETNLKHFVVERKAVNGSFIELAVVNPRPDKTYEYIDQSAFKADEVLYVYRLKIVDIDGSISYSWSTTVAHNVSSVKRTWGSIKALFR